MAQPEPAVPVASLDEDLDHVAGPPVLIVAGCQAESLLVQHVQRVDEIVGEAVDVVARHEGLENKQESVDLDRLLFWARPPSFGLETVGEIHALRAPALVVRVELPLQDEAITVHPSDLSRACLATRQASYQDELSTDDGRKQRCRLTRLDSAASI